MDIGVIIGMVHEANDNDSINVFILNKPIRFTKEDWIVNIDKSTKTLGLYTKKGRVKEIIIDIDSIKFITRIGYKKFGVDPIQNI